METLSPWGALAIGLPLLALHMVAVALGRALRTYSRSHLEILCARLRRPELADKIAMMDERTERGAEALEILTSLGMAAILGALAASQVPSAVVRTEVGLSLAIGGLGHVAAGVVGRVFAETVLARFWPLADSIRRMTLPLVVLSRGIEARAYRSARRSEPSFRPRPASVEVEVLTPGILGENPDADLPDPIRTMLERTVEFARTTVADVMIHRSAMVCLPADVSAVDAARAFSESGFSRLPLYGEGRDDVVGVLYAKDLWSRMVAAGGIGGTEGTEVRPREIAHLPMIVPESKNAAQLLDEFRVHQVQIAIVVGERGVLSGLVTLEDLIEQIVGSIEDEFDPQPTDPLKSLGDGAYEVNATFDLEDLNAKLDLHLPTDDDFSTVGGLAFHELGRVPEPGETFRVDGVVFTILEVAEHAIRRLRMDLTPDPQTVTRPSDRNGGHP